MTSDERTVAQIALEWAQGNATLAARFAGASGETSQMVIGDQTDNELKLPALIFSAEMTNEVDSPLAKEYRLKVEERTLQGQPSASEADDTFALVQTAFESPAPSRPASLNAESYYRMDKQLGSGITLGETISRDRTWRVFAKLV
jgi:hypothetical protein